MTDGIEDLARRMLDVAWRRRLTDFDVPDVVAPLDTQVAWELGYRDHMADELWRAAEWLEDRRYIVPAPISGRGAVEGFYTVTLAGHAFREGAY
jgi:hypothetical protein